MMNALRRLFTRIRLAFVPLGKGPERELIK